MKHDADKRRSGFAGRADSGLDFDLGLGIEPMPLLSIWVVATIVLVASFITGLPPQNWFGRLILLIPSVWIILAWIAGPAGDDAASDALYVFTLIVTLVTSMVIVLAEASRSIPPLVVPPSSCTWKVKLV